MSKTSEWCEGDLPQCPADFNAARYCIGLTDQRPVDQLALLAVVPDSSARQDWTFGALNDAVRRIAGGLQQAGVAKGDRVVLLLGDVPEFPLAYFGAIAAGAVATPLSSQLAAPEVADILRQVAPKVVLGGPDDLETEASRPDLSSLLSASPADFATTKADDPALLVFTSGSGGAPKGVLHAQRAFWARQSMHAGWHGIGPGDRVMHAGAFNWTYTLGVGLADTWSVGGTAILNAGSRSPEVWPPLVAQHKPSIFAGAPGVYRQILKYGAQVETAFASLRHAVTAGESLSAVIADEWRTRTGKPLLEALGMSEISTYVSTPPNRKAPQGVTGWAQPGRHIAVLDDTGSPAAIGHVGRLAVHRSDPGLMLGYWKRPDLTENAYCGEWFVTGDLASMAEDGAVTYAGRADDQMNAGGYRVDPQDIETALTGLDGVSECGAAELQLRDGVSIIAAWIVPEEGARLHRETILAEAKKHLAAYKLPRALFLVDALPRTPNGKLTRRRLTELEAEELR